MVLSRCFGYYCRFLNGKLEVGETCVDKTKPFLMWFILQLSQRRSLRGAFKVGPNAADHNLLPLLQNIFREGFSSQVFLQLRITNFNFIKYYTQVMTRDCDVACWCCNVDCDAAWWSPGCSVGDGDTGIQRLGFTCPLVSKQRRWCQFESLWDFVEQFVEPHQANQVFLLLGLCMLRLKFITHLFLQSALCSVRFHGTSVNIKSGF